MLAVCALSLAFSAPLCTRTAVPARAATPVAVVDPAVVSTTVDPAVLTGVVVAVAGTAFAYKNKDDVNATAVPAAKPETDEPKPKPKPIAKKKSTWGIVPTARRRKTSAHRMQGTMPPTPKRKLWKPPKDWTPPTKPVSSWYDRGDRLKAAPPPPLPPPKKKSMLEKFMASLTGGDEEVVPASPYSTGMGYGIVPAVRRRKISAHRMQGTMPKAPKRKL